jgi:hemerythrin-like domain-containing protein
MEAIRIIMDEHQSLAAIIHAIRLMIREVGAGRLAPDFKLFKAMVHYLDAYPEKRHHPKEDQFLFGPLKARTTEGADALARLEAEHGLAEARIQALDTALQGYADGAPDGFEAFTAAFETYANFYRNHMLLEEREILPLLKRHFTADDWARANAGCQATPDPMSGTRTADGDEDFRRLFSRLVAATPAPLGLGGGPYKDD